MFLGSGGLLAALKITSDAAPLVPTYIPDSSPGWIDGHLGTLSLRYHQITQATGRTNTAYGDNGSFAPALSDGGWVFNRPASVDALGNDHWCEWTDYGTWTGGADYTGGTVRNQSAAETYYGFWHDVDDYELYKVVAGSQTNLQTGAITPGGLGTDTWRLEISGNDLTVYRNGVEFETATDSAIPTGTLCGFTTSGFSINNRAGRVRHGNLPYVAASNVYVNNHWMPNNVSQVAVDDTCFANLDRAFNMSVTLDEGHLVNHQHHMDIDLGELRRISRLRNYASSVGLLRAQWTDFDVFGKVESGDSWTLIGEALSLSRYNSTVGWWYSDAFTPMDCRYVRIEINTTADSNEAGVRELEFWTGTESDLWYLTPTVTHGDVWGAWKAKGAANYTSSRPPWNSTEVSGDRLLQQRVGAVDWTVGAGWEFDGVDSLNTQLEADVTVTYSVACRVTAHTVAQYLWGDATGHDHIQGYVQDATTFLFSCQSDQTSVTVADTSDEIVVVLNGTEIWIDGSYVKDLVDPALIAGSALGLTIGGALTTPGTCDMAAFVIYNRALVQAEIEAITTQMQAL